MKNDIKIRKQIQRKIWVQLNLGWIITLSIILGFLTVLGLLAWLIISFNKNQNPKYANINIIYYISSSLISWLNNGTISGITFLIANNGLYFILPLALFFVSTQYKIRNTYIRRTLLMTTKEKNIKYIPLISSLIFFGFALSVFILLDLVTVIFSSINKEYSLNQNFFKNELINVIYFIMYYIFITGITYIITDLFRYKMDRKFVQKATYVIVFPVMFFAIVIPIVKAFLKFGSISFDYESPSMTPTLNTQFATVLTIFDSIFYVLMNPFKLEFIQTSEFIKNISNKNGFNFVTTEQAEIILWVFRGIWASSMLGYLAYHHFKKGGKYE